MKKDAHLCGSLSDHQHIILEREGLPYHPHATPRSPNTPNKHTRNFERPLLAVRILRVAEGVLNLGLASISAASEVIVAHGNGNLAHDIDEVVLKYHVGPAFATIDGKAFRSLATWFLVYIIRIVS